MLRIHGVPFSAHTRKVIAAAHYKNLRFELSQLVPVGPDVPAWFAAANPLRRIPVVEHDGNTIADSTVIALYLDKVSPQRPLYPDSPSQYARALFIEELVDGALAEHILAGVLFQRVIAPRLLGAEPNQELIERSLRDHIPPRLADLEAALGDNDWFAGEFSYADITVASILINFHYAGEWLDVDAYPGLHGFIRRACGHDPMAKTVAAEAAVVRGFAGLDSRLLDELGL